MVHLGTAKYHDDSEEGAGNLTQKLEGTDWRANAHRSVRNTDGVRRRHSVTAISGQTRD
jgi:hypothetical protein